MTNMNSFGRKVFWMTVTVVFFLLWHIYDYYAFLTLGGLGLYRLFMMDLFELTVSAFSIAANSYEAEGYGVIEDAEAELIEEMAEERERVVMNSNLFAKRMQEFEE